jgi:hypothetical protein
LPCELGVAHEHKSSARQSVSQVSDNRQDTGEEVRNAPRHLASEGGGQKRSSKTSGRAEGRVSRDLTLAFYWPALEVASWPPLVNAIATPLM